MDDRRGAERYAPPKPVPATFGGFEVKLVEISLIGCRIEHADRLPPKAKLGLKFAWRGSQVRLDATVTRSELASVKGKPAYVSGLQFCDNADASPPVIRDIVGYLATAAKKNEPAPQPAPVAAPLPAPAPAPAPPPEIPAAVEADEDEPELLSANYLCCAFSRGRWTKIYVDKPAQPTDGFTIRAPANESEADVLCRAYEKADAEKRKSMRASFQRDIARNRG